VTCDQPADLFPFFDLGQRSVACAFLVVVFASVYWLCLSLLAKLAQDRAHLAEDAAHTASANRNDHPNRHR
jgi:hypothetical protein